MNLSESEESFLVIGDRTADDEVMYPDIDLELKAEPDGTRGFHHKDGTPYPRVPMPEAAGKNGRRPGCRDRTAAFLIQQPTRRNVTLPGIRDPNRLLRVFRISEASGSVKAHRFSVDR